MVDEDKVFKEGQQAFEKGLSFLEGNPYRCNDPRHYLWHKGWAERNDFYERKDIKIMKEEDEKYNQELLQAKELEEKKKELDKALTKYKKSKKGKAEEAGQGTLF